MNASTTSPLGIDFPKQIVALLLKDFDDGKKQAAHILWNALMSFLGQYWLLVLAVLLVILFLSGFQAFTTRWWGWFGSVLYNYLYFGILFIIGLIWGPEVFVSDLFDILAVVLYVVCFLLVGKILSGTGIHSVSSRHIKRRRC